VCVCVWGVGLTLVVRGFSVPFEDVRERERERENPAIAGAGFTIIGFAMGLSSFANSTTTAVLMWELNKEKK